MNGIAANILEIRGRMRRAAAECGRSPEDIHLVAVSKQQPDERIDSALSAGQRVFGENRVREAEERWHRRRMAYPDLQLHLVGALQTNKVRSAVALFDAIETVDRIKLADALRDEMQKQRKFPLCFIQVNTGEEEQKAGVRLRDASALFDHCNSIGLDIGGLMVIPPAGDPPALHFALLKKMAAEYGLGQLSMGMTGDFEKAIAAGATLVRVGTGIFGMRSSSGSSG